MTRAEGDYTREMILTALGRKPMALPALHAAIQSNKTRQALYSLVKRMHKEGRLRIAAWWFDKNCGRYAPVWRVSDGQPDALMPELPVEIEEQEQVDSRDAREVLQDSRDLAKRGNHFASLIAQVTA